MGKIEIVVSSVVPADPIAVFDAFLQFMRAAGVRGGVKPEKIVTVERPAERPPEERTGRGPAVQSVQVGSAVDDLSLWDEPTKSRPDVVREYQQKTARKVEHVESIIVEDDLSMTQPMVTAAPEMAPRGESRVERFSDEMLVLIKYGHTQQVPREIERWVKTYPDDLDGALRLAEFEMLRVDASTGLDRLFTVAHRSAERGAVEHLRRAMDRLQVVAPNDLRFTALRSRLGLR